MRWSGRTALKVLLALIGVLISVVLIATVFFQISFSGGLRLTPRFTFAQFLGQIPKQGHWLWMFFLLSASVIPLRALQWQATLKRRVPFRERYHFVAIGAFVHNALPGKFGDIFRSFLMARTQNVPFVQALGSVAVCKLLEFAALMLLVGLSFLGPFSQTLSRFSQGLRVALAVCLGLVVVVVLLARYSAFIARWLRRERRLPKAQSFLLNVSRGLGTARSPKGLAKALFVSIPPVLAPALAYGLAMRGIGVKNGLFAGAVVLGAIALGQATPGIPAGTGIYYFVTSWTARNLGAAPDDAAAFAALTHLGTITSQILVGGTSVWIRRIRWRDLKRTTVEAVDDAKHPSHFGQAAEAEHAK